MTFKLMFPPRLGATLVICAALAALSAAPVDAVAQKQTDGDLAIQDGIGRAFGRAFGRKSAPPTLNRGHLTAPSRNACDRGPGARARVLVTDASGRPIDARVSVFKGRVGRRAKLCEQASVRGALSVAGLGRGFHRFVAACRGGGSAAKALTINGAGGGTHRLVLVCPNPPSIRPAVAPTARPACAMGGLAAVHVMVTDAYGRPQDAVLTLSQGAATLCRRATVRGSENYVGVRAGAYRIGAECRGGGRGEVRFTAPARGAARVVLRCRL